MIHQKWPCWLVSALAKVTLAIGLMMPATAARGQNLILTEQLRHMQIRQSSFTLIDVRPSEDYDRRHIEGAENLSPTAILKAGLPKMGELVLYCGDMRCPLGHEAARTLITNGYKNVKVLYGGIAEWQKQHYPVVATAEIPASDKATPEPTIPMDLSPHEAWARIRQDETTLIVDLRPEQDYASGHLEGAMSLPLEALKVDLIKRGVQIVVYDRLPERSRSGTSLLVRSGYTVHELAGGIAAWSASGYPLVTGAPGNH